MAKTKTAKDDSMITEAHQLEEEIKKQPKEQAFEDFETLFDRMNS